MTFTLNVPPVFLFYTLSCCCTRWQSAKGERRGLSLPTYLLWIRFLCWKAQSSSGTWFGAQNAYAFNLWFANSVFSVLHHSPLCPPWTVLFMCCCFFLTLISPSLLLSPSTTKHVFFSSSLFLPPSSFSPSLLPRIAQGTGEKYIFSHSQNTLNALFCVTEDRSGFYR